MSFYTGNRNTPCCPGPINGNPLNGLCERVCIQTTKVFDSCIKRISLQNVAQTAVFTTPPTEPITFIGASSSQINPATLSNLTVDRLTDRPNYARVSGIVNIPINITYSDATGTTNTATSTSSVPFDVILFVPQPSVIPYNVQAFGALSSTIGTYSGNNIFTLDECITIIIRIVVEAELCIPAYGYCQIPPSTDYTQDVCEGVFDLPLYPTATLNNNQ